MKTRAKNDGEGVMAKPGEYDFVPLSSGVGYFGSASATLSIGIFQWVYKADGHGLKKSKAVYRVKGQASKWQEINERARGLCDAFNAGRFGGIITGRKSETI